MPASRESSCTDYEQAPPVSLRAGVGAALLAEIQQIQVGAGSWLFQY